MMWIAIGTFLICACMLALLIYLVWHSRARSSEIVGMLDTHHTARKTEVARMNAEMATTKRLASDIHSIVEELKHHTNTDIDDFLRTKKLKS